MAFLALLQNTHDSESLLETKQGDTLIHKTASWGSYRKLRLLSYGTVASACVTNEPRHFLIVFLKLVSNPLVD